MIVTLQTERIRTIEQVAAFAEANEPVEFQPLDRTRRTVVEVAAVTVGEHRGYSRTARSRTSGGKCSYLLMPPSSRRTKSPALPGRFTTGQPLCYKTGQAFFVADNPGRFMPLHLLR